MESEEIMTPEEFEEAMIQLRDKESTYGDEEMIHINMDGLVIDLLRSLGYEAGCDIFDSTHKWYSRKENKMLIVIMVIGLALIGLATFLDNVLDDGTEFLGGLGLLLSFVSLIMIIIFGIKVSELSVIDERIAMYQAENAKIEEQIAEVVSQYQEYESGIFKEVAPDQAVTLVALYPDLKSDTLVQSQITVYTENNTVIKNLKDDAIKGDVLRWWLYFGKSKGE